MDQHAVVISPRASVRLAVGVLIVFASALCCASLLLAPVGVLLFIVAFAVMYKPLRELRDREWSSLRIEAVRTYVEDKQRTVTSPSVQWISAGPISVGPSGGLRVPELPKCAGIRRLDLLGPGEGQLAISFDQSEELRDTLDLEEPILLAHLAAGGLAELSYLVKVAVGASTMDLDVEENRRALVDVIQRQALSTGVWDVG